MFTGIITAVGSLRAARRSPAAMEVEIDCDYDALVLGESIAVDGVCLTVAKILGHGFLANVSAETLSCTTLGAMQPGGRVNLERALAVGDRLGGHIVAGHVDGVGTVQSRTREGDAERWRFEAPMEVQRFLAVKGSVTVDGVSLTVNGLGPSTFDVMLVPHTMSHTTLGSKHPGAKVNLEADVLARYVARALESPVAGAREGVTMDLLERQGFLK